jgi:hypothetical protein
MTLTQARKKLRDKAKKLGGQNKLAESIGCTEAMLSLVLSGQRGFGPKFMFYVQKKFKIPAKVWST